MLLETCIVLLIIKNCTPIIEINLELGSSKIGSIVTYSGHNDKHITETEINMFNFTDDNIKYGFRVELGRRPDDVFLNDPTKYGKVFQELKWKETKRRIKVKKAEVVEVINIDTVIKVSDVTNNTTGDIIVPSSIYEMVENGITSTWSDTGVPNDRIDYEVHFIFGTRNYTYANKWRNTTPQYVSQLFGTKSIGNITINPGGTVTKKLSGKRTLVVLKITYVASLIGQIFGNYAHEYGKYHFWAPFASNIMKAANLSNELLTTEIIEIDCYTDPRVDVSDKITNKIIIPYNPNKPFRAIKRSMLRHVKIQKKTKTKKKTLSFS